MIVPTREELVLSMTRGISTLQEEAIDVALRSMLGDRYQEPKRVTEAKEALFGAALTFLNTYGYRWLRRSSHSITDYDDLVSSTMLRAYEKLDTFYGWNGWAFLEWLLSLANSARKKEFRRLERYREAAAIAASPEASSEASPGSELEAREDREKRERFVRSALKLLPQPFRELLESQYFTNKSIKELSKLHRLTPNTVKTKLRRGKLRLCWTLGGMGLRYKVIEGIEHFDARYARLLDPDLEQILFASPRKSSDSEPR